MKNKIFFITDWILIVLLLAFLLNSIASTVILKILKTDVEKKGRINLTIAHFSINAFTGNVSADEILVYSQLNSDTIFSGGEIEINEFAWISFFKTKNVSISGIEIYDGAFNIKHSNSTDSLNLQDTSGNQFENKIRDFLNSSKLNSVSISEVLLKNFQLNFLDKGCARIGITKGNFSFYGLSATGSRPTIDSLTASVEEFKWITSDSLYTIQVNEIHCSSHEKHANIHNVLIQPNYSHNDFSSKAGKQTDRFDINIPSIEFEDFDIRSLIFDNLLYADKVEIDSGQVKVYRNKYYRFVSETKKRIRELVNQLPIKLKINECNVKNTEVSYAELIPPSKDAGGVTLTEVSARILDISNIDSSTLKFSSKALIDNSSLSLQIEFPQDPSVVHGKGFIKKLLMEKMNPLLESASSVTFTNGIIDSMHFNIDINKDTINGTLLMIFHDLRVSAIDPATNDTTGLFRNLKTEIANRIVLKSNNKDIKNDEKEMHYKKPYKKDRFIIHNLVQTILTGIQKSIK